MSKDKVNNVIICGVGGQGILLAGEILANAAMQAGLDAKKADVHGMAQRGGSVVSHVRFGPVVNSPLVAFHEADVILSFEQLEVVRYLDYLKPGGVCIINTQKILPITVATGASQYPEGILDFVKTIASKVIAVDAMALAKEAGEVRAVNTALLGILSTQFDLPVEAWEKAFQTVVKPKFLEINLKAFGLGKKQVI